MDYAVIRYRARPERREENRSLIQRVFGELRETAPPDVRYLVLELEDGTFLHIVATPPGADARSLTGTTAFKAFAAGVGERQEGPPVRLPARVVGQWGMLREDPDDT